MTARTSIAPLGAALLTVLASCASSAGGQPREERLSAIDRLIAAGRYDEALEEAAAMRDDGADDESAELAHRRASVAWLLESGRQLTFEDRDDEALAAFEQALAIAPDSPQARNWIAKTRDKLAESWVLTGLELHAQDNLEGAIDAYRRALDYSPGDSSARAGIDVARTVSAYREDKGDRYLEKGLSARADYFLELALGELGRGEKYLREDERVRRNKGEVRALLAEDRVLVARRFAEEGRWAAARNEYRMALLNDESNTDAQQGFELADKEASVLRLIDDARMKIVRGEHDEARTVIAEARALTTAQAEAIDAIAAELDDSIHEGLYQRALALERDRNYPEAIEAYARLVEQAQYYKDAIQRHKTLSDNVADAADYYERAAQAATPEERLLLYRAIDEVIWPGYRDVRERIRALEASLPQDAK